VPRVGLQRILYEDRSRSADTPVRPSEGLTWKHYQHPDRPALSTERSGRFLYLGNLALRLAGRSARAPFVALLLYGDLLWCMDFFNERGDIEKTVHKLPHWQQGRVSIFVTFRLADSLPQEVLAPLIIARDRFVADNPKPWDEDMEDAFHRQFSVKLDAYLDAGHGSCALRKPAAAQTVAERLHYADGEHYDLHSYVIMPNHVHVLFSPHETKALPNLLKSWKGISSRLISQSLLSDLHPFWQPDYFDRLIRSPQHLAKVQRYIQENPLKAKLPQTDYLLWSA
jgi:putative transposase